MSSSITSFAAFCDLKLTEKTEWDVQCEKESSKNIAAARVGAIALDVRYCFAGVKVVVKWKSGASHL